MRAKYKNAARMAIPYAILAVCGYSGLFCSNLIQGLADVGENIVNFLNAD